MPYTFTLLDDFNRTGATDLGGNWGVDSIGAGGTNFNITSNQAYNGNGPYVENHYTASTPGVDVGGGYTIATLPGAGTASFGGNVRLQTPGSAAADGYRWQYVVTGTEFSVMRVVNGAESAPLATATSTPQAGDQYALIAIGTGATVTLKLYRERSSTQTELINTSDTNAARIVSAGQIGMWAYDTTGSIRIDNFGTAAEAASGNTYTKVGLGIIGP